MSSNRLEESLIDADAKRQIVENRRRSGRFLYFFGWMFFGYVFFPGPRFIKNAGNSDQDWDGTLGKQEETESSPMVKLIAPLSRKGPVRAAAGLGVGHQTASNIRMTTRRGRSERST